MCSWECRCASPINGGLFHDSGVVHFDIEVRHWDCGRLLFEPVFLMAQMTILYVDYMPVLMDVCSSFSYA